jgi:hypothetical protein
LNLVLPNDRSEMDNRMFSTDSKGRPTSLPHTEE